MVAKVTSGSEDGEGTEARKRGAKHFLRANLPGGAG